MLPYRSSIVALCVLAFPLVAAAAPNVPVRTVDMREVVASGGQYISAPVVQPNLAELERHRRSDLASAPPLPGTVAEPATHELTAKTHPLLAFEDIPGNKYPRKHTLYLNFSGGPLRLGARDNSAENESVLARTGEYPFYGGGETRARSIAQAVQADMAAYGVRVMYETRPSKIVPYTMEMVGGSASDTNIDGNAGGVAPTADCGAKGQRHVVYTFSNGGSSVLAANTASQEAAHAWGLDHTLDCTSVMSYCGGFMDGGFTSGCQPLCETQCQGAGTIGCRLEHEEICGEGSEAQDDNAELLKLFGGPEPDIEPPTVILDSPEDGSQLAVGEDVFLRAQVDDNFGGFGWKFVIAKDDEVLFDQVDYTKEVDEEARAALNLTNLDAGVYTVTVIAEDHNDNVTEATATVFVGVESMASGGVSESEGDEDEGGGTSSGDSAGAGDEGGGGCSVSGTPMPQGWLLGLALFGFGRMRRRPVAGESSGTVAE